MSSTPAALEAILTNPTRYLSGTDLKIKLPLGRPLLNAILEARPDDVPVEELLLDPLDDNKFVLHLEVQAPVIGRVRRAITFSSKRTVLFPEKPWLHLDIINGFKLFDKPILKLLHGQLTERLPKGVELTTEYLRIHLPTLLSAAGQEAIIPLLHRLALRSEQHRLLLYLHIKE
jgi:hypothetical protein